MKCERCGTHAAHVHRNGWCETCVREEAERLSALPHTILIEPPGPDEPGWFVCIPDLPGCATVVYEASEIWSMVSEAKRLWVEACLAQGHDVPVPKFGKEKPCD